VFDPRSELAADPAERGGQPSAAGGAGVAQPHVPGLHRHHGQRGEFTGARRPRREVRQAQVVSVLLVAGDVFVVVDAVAAAAQDEFAAVYLDGSRVVRGVAVDQVDAAADQPAGEPDRAAVQAVFSV
jgi:hypothetical protein